MGPSSTTIEPSEKTIVSILNEECNPTFLMNTIFDETMINQTHNIECKTREFEIKKLLESIETFHHEDPKDF